MKTVLNLVCVAAFFAVLGSLALAQSAGNAKFEWNWRSSHELGWKQSISRSNELSAEVRNKLVEALMAQLRPLASNLSEGELRNAAADTRITFVSLCDEKQSVAAQAGGDKSGCSPTGNCPFWIFGPANDGYSVLLKGKAQTFTIQPSRTNGLNDIVLARHGSAFESELRVYRFNGKSYTPGPCYVAAWQYLGPDGEYHDLPEPRITPCGQTAAQ